MRLKLPPSPLRRNQNLPISDLIRFLDFQVTIASSILADFETQYISYTKYKQVYETNFIGDEDYEVDLIKYFKANVK